MAYDIIIGRNESDKKDLGKNGLISIGKSYVKMGQYTSLSNPIYMDIARSHVILVAGKRGSGKSYSLGVLAEELSNLPKEVAQNISSLIFDTMGIYWTMKYKNEKDKKLLEDWNLKTKNLPVKIFVPYGHYKSYIEKGIPVDKQFALDATEMKPEDWILMFSLEIISPVAVLIQRTISKLMQEKNRIIIQDIIKELEQDKLNSLETKNAAIGLFEAADTWGIFAKSSTEVTQVKDLISAGETTILDLSVYNSVGAFNVRALAISLLSKKIFNERMDARKSEEIKSISRGLDLMTRTEKKEIPLIWIFIDEAHEFLPMEGKTVATDALVQILREGRQPGISIVLATQQPGQIHRDVMTQSDLVIAHRVTSKIDVESLNNIMQSYLLESVKRYMDELPSERGAAIILDDNSERIYPMRVRPRFTWHGGEAPSAVKIKKEL
ncbi:MAG: DUF87 domain-containing protein [Nanoarchaeota archaeon]